MILKSVWRLCVRTEWLIGPDADEDSSKSSMDI